jgi:hypothetical protein
MSSVKKINFSVSNLYVIMGMNYFKNFDKVLFHTWKAYNKEDYDKCSKLLDELNKSSSKKEKIVRTNKSNFQQIQDFQEKYNFKIQDKVKESQKSNSNTKINTINKDMIDNLPKTIPKEELAQIKKLVNNSTNTVFGCRNESTALEEFKKIKNCKTNDKQKKFEYKILEDKGISFNLIGKVDAITDKNEVVEIKNRMKCLFKELRGYEKPQIMTYMYMNNSTNGYLVENYKQKEGNNIYIIDICYEDNYFEENIHTALVKYYSFFKIFISNEEWKLDLLKGEESKLYKEFISFSN